MHPAASWGKRAGGGGGSFETFNYLRGAAVFTSRAARVLQIGIFFTGIEILRTGLAGPGLSW